MTPVSDAAIALIKEFEGLRLQSYQDSVGVWTIGYGTTAAAGVGIAPKAGMRITEADADHYLRAGVNKFAATIAPMIKQAVTPNEFGACVSLAYNIGPGNFAKSSVLRKLNVNDRPGAARAFAAWNKAGGKVLSGLVRRRAAEAALFLS
jgi:lysozyme